MTDDYVQGTLELTRAFDSWWLPQRPLCCDDDYSQLHRRSRADALKCKHVETNPSALVNTIVVDIDDEEARAIALWGHRGMLPNWIAENPANGHAHAGWVLTYPVCRTDMARLKPLKLLRAVTEGLRRSVDGDEGYSGLLMKNPLSDAWDSDLCREDTYDLPDLVAALEEHGDMPPKSWTRTKRAREVGVGRNCTLFDEARTLAYAGAPTARPHARLRPAARVRAPHMPRTQRDALHGSAARTRGKRHCQEHPQVDNHAKPHVARRGRRQRHHTHRHPIRKRTQGRQGIGRGPTEQDESIRTGGVREMTIKTIRKKRPLPAKELAEATTFLFARFTGGIRKREEWIDEQATLRESIRAYHDDDGHSWAATAKHFNMTQGAVRGRAYRARKERAAEAEEKARNEAHKNEVPLFE